MRPAARFAAGQAAGFADLTEPELAISEARVLAQGRIEALATGEPRRIAVADARCEVKLDFARQRNRIEERYLTAMMKRFEAEIAGVQESGRAAAANARTALAGADS